VRIFHPGTLWYPKAPQGQKYYRQIPPDAGQKPSGMPVRPSGSLERRAERLDALRLALVPYCCLPKTSPEG